MRSFLGRAKRCVVGGTWGGLVVGALISVDRMLRLLTVPGGAILGAVIGTLAASVVATFLLLSNFARAREWSDRGLNCAGALAGVGAVLATHAIVSWLDPSEGL